MKLEEITTATDAFKFIKFNKLLKARELESFYTNFCNEYFAEHREEYLLAMDNATMPEYDKKMYQEMVKSAINN